MKNIKESTILIRATKEDHDNIILKSLFLGKNKSEFMREASLNYISKDEGNFKKILEVYKTDADNRNYIVNILFNYYRYMGFPFYELTDEEKDKKMLAISKTHSPLLDNDFLQSNFVGVGLASSFHKHIFEAKYEGSLSPVEAYNDDLKLKDCIKRMLDLGRVPNKGEMRTILKTRNGVRGVGNFRPAIAKFIYDTYCPENGKVIDPCSGFSGRLCGLIASNKELSYIGIDPDGKTMRGNVDCASHYKNKYNFKFGFYLGCAEEVMPDFRENYYDLVFTSPPYFSVEKYSDNKNQSSNKFIDYNIWLNEFLYKILSESFRVLKKNAYLVINIKNYNEYKIADDLCNFCVKLGFILEKTYKMKLPNNEFSRKAGQQNFHTEPIFVFRK